MRFHWHAGSARRARTRGMRLAAKRPMGIDYLERWVTTSKHTDIGVMYITTASEVFVLAGFMAMLTRIETAFPGRTIVSEATYNGLPTVHGKTMIFSMVGAMILGLPQLIFLYDVVRSMEHGKPAPPDPWE